MQICLAWILLDIEGRVSTNQYSRCANKMETGLKSGYHLGCECVCVFA